MPEDLPIKFMDRVKYHIANNKTLICCTVTAAVTATAVAGLQKSALKEAYDFIESAGLMEKFLESVPAEEIYS